jgi:hypothetical protein
MVFHIFSPLSLFSKIKIGEITMLPVSVYPLHYQLFNAGTSLNETWYIYHDTLVHFNGVFHKSLPLVCVSIRESIYRF